MRLAIAAWCCCVCASAQDAPTARAYVDRTTVAVRKPFLLNIEVAGKQVNEVTIPDVDGLNINKRPDQKRFSFVGTLGGAATTHQLGYYAQAARAGKFTIGPILVQVDGQTIQTEPIVITAVDAPEAPAQQSAPTATPQQAQNAAPQQQRDLTWEDAVFTDSAVDKREVYQGEPVTLTMNLWAVHYPGIHVWSDSNPVFPTTEGFYATPIEAAKEGRERNGWQYEVTQYRQTLYATKTGELLIGPWRWSGVASYHFRQQAFNFETDPITITVKPLPPAPDDFSGAVGTFQVAAKLLRNQVIQGVPTTLVITVTGRGNPNALTAPQLPSIEDAHVADPESHVTTVETPGGPGIEKSFSYAITPLKPGQMGIPSIAFRFFNPVTGAYETGETTPFALEVLPSAEGGERVLVTSGIPSEPGGVKVLGEDIQPLVQPSGELGPAGSASGRTAAAVAAPPVAYVVLALYMRRRRRFERDTGYAREYHAKARGQKRLRQVAEAPEPAEELFKALTGYLADKFNTAEGGMTSDDARALLESHAVDSELTRGISKILRSCERARYGTGKLSPDEVSALIQAATNAIDRLEDAIKKERKS